MNSLVKDSLITLVLIAVLILLLRLVVGIYSVIDSTMAPELQIGDRLVINRLAYQYGAPQRGEVVCFKTSALGSDHLGRIIGIPGDILEIKDKMVYVNGIPLHESYLKNSPAYTLSAFQLASNSYFLLEDNRSLTDDELAGWTVSRAYIQGLAWIYAWPPDRWGAVESYSINQQLASAEVP